MVDSKIGQEVGPLFARMKVKGIEVGLSIFVVAAAAVVVDDVVDGGWWGIDNSIEIVDSVVVVDLEDTHLGLEVGRNFVVVVGEVEEVAVVVDVDVDAAVDDAEEGADVGLGDFDIVEAEVVVAVEEGAEVVVVVVVVVAVVVATVVEEDPFVPVPAPVHVAMDLCTHQYFH